MIKGIERVAPMNHFTFRGVEVRLHGVRQDSPPFMSSVTYELIVDTDEDDRRLDLMHYNVRKYGTISNTVAAATKLEGNIIRAQALETAVFEGFESGKLTARNHDDSVPAPAPDLRRLKPWPIEKS